VSFSTHVEKVFKQIMQTVSSNVSDMAGIDTAYCDQLPRKTVGSISLLLLPSLHLIQKALHWRNQEEKPI
jgi:hypothetical protein